MIFSNYYSLIVTTLFLHQNYFSIFMKSAIFCILRSSMREMMGIFLRKKKKTAHGRAENAAAEPSVKSASVYSVASCTILD